MQPRIFTIHKGSAPLIFHAQSPTTLWVDRVVFNTSDPNWSQRIAGTQLTVVMFLSKDDDDGGTTQALQKENRSIAALNRNTFVQPVFDIEGSWAFTPNLTPTEKGPHTWSYGVTLGTSLELQDHESIALTIRTTAEYIDGMELIEAANIQRYIQQN